MFSRRVLTTMFAGKDRLLSWSKWKYISRHGPRYITNRFYSSAGQIILSPEVAEAKHNQKPIVALESTIITHGMPYPENIKTAQMVENEVRQNGAVPATIAIIDGEIHAGLSDVELQNLGHPDVKAIKTSRRDFPYVLSQGLAGGTTVSGTMIAAHRAGIDVFVTGGIGGVHQGAPTSMDISADLTELGRTPIAVVSAGVKSILDIGLTLEYLETEGVCVATYGDNHDFPAFFTPTSGFKSPYNVSSPEEAAKLIDAGLSLALGSGFLIAVPIPTEEGATGSKIEEAIQLALSEAKTSQISGKEVTPFILARVNELTGGSSLTANIALVRNNARVGSLIAVELAKLRKQVAPRKIEHVSYPNLSPPSETKNTSATSRPVVVGCINVDFMARFKTHKRQSNGATYPGVVHQTFGGVGRNLASCLSRLGSNPLFLSAMGMDNYSEYFFQQANHMDLSGVRRVEGMSSAMYCGVLEADGELIYGLGGSDVHSKVTPDYISQYIEDLSSAPFVVLDGNIPAETIAYVADICHDNEVPVWFETTDQHLTTKPLLTGAIKKLTYISPNINELRVMNAHINGIEAITKKCSPDVTLEETLEEALELVRPLVELTPNILVTLGEFGAMLVTQKGDASVAYHCPARPEHKDPPSIASVSGAGDCLAAGFITYLMMGQTQKAALKAAVLASQLSLQSNHAVPESMSRQLISPDVLASLDPWPIQEIKM